MLSPSSGDLGAIVNGWLDVTSFPAKQALLGPHRRCPDSTVITFRWLMHSRAGMGQECKTRMEYKRVHLERVNFSNSFMLFICLGGDSAHVDILAVAPTAYNEIWAYPSSHSNFGFSIFYQYSTPRFWRYPDSLVEKEKQTNP